MAFATTLFWAVILFTVTAALIDVFERRIPNWLTVTTTLLSVTYYWLASGWPGVVFSLQGFAVGFGALSLLWLIGGGGGGDVKLMAAMGALFGPQLVLVIFFASVPLAFICVSALKAAGLMAPNAVDEPSESPESIRDRTVQCSDARERRSIPYALPAAAAAWVVLAWQVAIR